MPRKRILTVHCPTCRKPVRKGAEEFPFCCERCRLIDLGKWASGEYVVSSPAQDISDTIREHQPEDPKDKR